MRMPSIAIFLAVSASMATLTEVSASSPYVIDGLQLGGTFARGREYQCKPSEQFADCTFCRRNDEERGRRFRLSSVTKVLHDRHGALGYVSREVRPAFFSGNDIANEIKRLSTRFGPVSREIRLPDRDDVYNMRIAIWGKLELEQIDQQRLAEFQSPRAQTVLIDHLGDVERSRRLGLPVYRLKGGPGFLWSAASNEDGRGHLRFLIFDAAALGAPTAPAIEPVVSPSLSETPATSAGTAPVVITGTLKEATSAKNEKKRVKAEDRLPHATDQDAVLAVEQRRIASAERIAAEERVKARLAWERFEAEKASRKARERVTWIAVVLFVLLVAILALIHRMHRPQGKALTMGHLAALARRAQTRIWLNRVYEKARQLIGNAIVRGRAVIALSQSLIVSHPRG
jgi:hypothetical protein